MLLLYHAIIPTLLVFFGLQYFLYLHKTSLLYIAQHKRYSIFEMAVKCNGYCVAACGDGRDAAMKPKLSR